jgi:hypothetical protein
MVVFLDEPTLGLDPRRKREVVEQGNCNMNRIRSQGEYIHNARQILQDLRGTTSVSANGGWLITSNYFFIDLALNGLANAIEWMP